MTQDSRAIFGEKEEEMSDNAILRGYPLFNKDRMIYELDGCLRIGSDDDDVIQISKFIDVWKYLISLCNGHNSIEEICSTFNEKYSVDKEITCSYLEKFAKRNIIEILTSEYQDTEKNKYFQSALTYYSSRGLGGNDLFNKLQNMYVTVLGCGGGGSQIAFQLSQLGVGHIHIVDPDVVTTENVNRQALFSMDSIGRKKTEVTKEMLLQKNPYVEVSSSEKRMTCVDDVKKEISDSEWVFCAMDEPPYIAQRIVNRACMQMGIKSVYAFSQKSAGKMFLVNPEKSACCDCLLKSCDSERYRSFIKLFAEGNEQDLITANIYTNITLLCAWITKKWVDVVGGAQKNPWNKLYRYSFDSFKEEEFITYEKREDCPTCGESEKRILLEQDEIWRILKIG